MSKPKLCELFGVEVNEEFWYNDATPKVFRINQKGHLEQKDLIQKDGPWEDMAHQYLLEEMLQFGIKKLPKRMPIDKQQYSYLKFLHELFYAETLGKDVIGTYAITLRSPNGLIFVRIPSGSCLDELFEKTLSSVNIPKLLERYEEAHNV